MANPLKDSSDSKPRLDGKIKDMMKKEMLDKVEQKVNEKDRSVMEAFKTYVDSKSKSGGDNKPKDK